MINKVTDSLNQLTDFKQCRFLLAVSGGVDSMVLLQIFNSLKLDFSVAHCNFNLRADESDLDEKLVRETCELIEVEYFVKQFETMGYKNEKGISTQMAARDLRYNWFAELVKEKKVDFIVTAHHLDDNIETVFLNLARGTGIRGISGMEISNGEIFRPMLKISKKEIVAYAVNHQIEYREDASNASNDYKRNKLRNQILPLFQELNPSFVETMGNNISQLREVNNFYKKSIGKELKNIVKNSINSNTKISTKSLMESTLPKLSLYEILSSYEFNSTQAEEVFLVLSNANSVGKEFISPSYRLIVDRNELIISPKKSEKEESILINNGEKFVTYSNKLSLKRLPVSSIELNSDSKNAFLDADKIKFPLLLRRWKKGDRFCPLGMVGKKKVSDFLIDEKISRIEKDEVFVLETNGNICWLVGYRIDDNYKITPNTKNVLKLTLKK